MTTCGSSRGRSPELQRPRSTSDWLPTYFRFSPCSGKAVAKPGIEIGYYRQWSVGRQPATERRGLHHAGGSRRRSMGAFDLGSVHAGLLSIPTLLFAGLVLMSSSSCGRRGRLRASPLACLAGRLPTGTRGVRRYHSDPTHHSLVGRPAEAGGGGRPALHANGCASRVSRTWAGPGCARRCMTG